MKRKLFAIFLLFALLTLGGCSKCYDCVNSCKVCQDAHYYILVQSDALSYNYYNLYIDSLTSLGWSCRDTASNRNIRICAQRGNQINTKLFLTEESGFACKPVQ
jgi:hypothetical protein